MKTIKLKLKYSELEALYAYLFNKVIPVKSHNLVQKIVASSLIELYTKIAPKVLFKKDGKVSLTITATQACALMLHYTTATFDFTTYIGMLMERIVRQIDQQLA